TFSSDDTYMAVAHTTTPFVTIYKRSGDTFTKLANPAALPTGNSNGIVFSSKDDFLIVVNTASDPYITIYSFDVGQFAHTTVGKMINLLPMTFVLIILGGVAVFVIFKKKQE
ncbi:MAG: hypothetical protein PHR14_10560, partial [Oscillospiraceae bacterium]|nr:hypothetical protein [Oscillospiraceae bacterium]